MEDEIFRVEELTVSFKVKDAYVHAVDHLSIALNRKSILCMLGETGCGKSVFASSILRILPDNAIVQGKMYLQGEEITGLNDEAFRKYRGKGISAVPQNPSTSLNPLMRSGRQVDEMILLHEGDKEKSIARKKTIELFKQLGLPRLPQLCDDFPFELSGGMRQRVLVAIGVAAEPKFLIVDEPTKGLDWVRKREVIEKIGELQRKFSASMLLITHDFSVAELLANYIAVMYAGEIVEFGTKDEVMKHPKHPFTQGLISALPRNGFNAVKGYSPPLTDIPGGCRFHPRCPIAQKSCSEEHMELPLLKREHVVRCPYA